MQHAQLKTNKHVGGTHKRSLEYTVRDPVRLSNDNQLPISLGVHSQKQAYDQMNRSLTQRTIVRTAHFAEKQVEMDNFVQQFPKRKNLRRKPRCTYFWCFAQMPLNRARS